MDLLMEHLVQCANILPVAKNNVLKHRDLSKKKLFKIFNRMFCKYCGRSISATGSGMDINGMCERCHENGGDDE